MDARWLVAGVVALAGCAQPRAVDPGAIRVRSDQNPVWRVWGDRITAALPRGGLPEVQNPVLVVVDDDAVHDDAVTFSVYEDAPDALHRLDSFRLDRNGNLARENLLAEGDDDLWVPIARP
ncbi:MAG: hypothetical protein R3B49_05890 [Phycisphaerales bacterium]